MAGSVNKVILVGNVGKDPEVRTTQDGKKIVSLSLATSETWNDRSSGERKERTEWHRVAIFNDRIGDVAERFVKKGSKIYIEGQLQTRKWTDPSGVERYSTEIVLAAFRGDLTLLSSPNGNGNGEQQQQQSHGGSHNGGQQGGGGGSAGWNGNRARQPGPSSGERRQATQGGGGGWTPPRGGDLDDEIPF